MEQPKLADLTDAEIDEIIAATMPDEWKEKKTKEEATAKPSTSETLNEVFNILNI